MSEKHSNGSSDIIKMDYPMMEDMSKTFLQATETLEDLKAQLNTAAQRIEDGALLGRAGSALCEHIRSQLTTQAAALGELTMELANDTQNVISNMQSADSSSSAFFG